MEKFGGIGEVLRPLFALGLAVKKTADAVLREQLQMTLAQFRILLAIKRHRNISQGALAKFWGMTQASTSRQVDILRQKKLLRHKRNPANKREYIFTLTPTGVSRLKKARQYLDVRFEELFHDSTITQRKTLSTVLTQFLHLIHTNEKK